MVRSLRRDLALALAWTLFVLLMLLGPGADSSQAAQCKGGAKPAYELSDESATKATLCLLNKARSARGLDALRPDAKQAEAADEHNRLMVRTDCFSHECPGEKDLVARIISTGYLPCACSWGVAENLAYGAGASSSPKKVVALWMNSAGHRANILNPRFDEIGVAVDPGSPVGGDGDAATYTTIFGFKT